MKYLFFDIECSNCFNGIGKMCEFGYVLTDENFNVISKNEFVMNPGKARDCRFHLRDRMKQAHCPLAYDFDYYFSQPEFPSFYNSIKKLLEDNDTMCFGWSISNDIMHLISSCKRYRKEQFKYNCYDVQKMAGDYLELNFQASLKKAYLRLVGRNKIASIQEHLSSDDAKMTMMIFEALCVLEQKSPMALVNESEYAKENSLEYFNKIEQKEKEKSRIATMKKLIEADSGLLTNDRQSLKGIYLSTEVKKNIDNFDDFAEIVHQKGYLFVKFLSEADVLVCLDDDSMQQIIEGTREYYNGRYVLLRDL